MSKQDKQPSSKHDPRWPSILNTLATVALFYTLPERLKLGPGWLLPIVTSVLLISILVTNAQGKVITTFVLGIVMQAFLTTAEAWSVIFLIAGLPDKKQSAHDLLGSSAAIWVSNILIFAAWYWRLDAGGPHRRSLREKHSEGAFLFPQMTLPPGSKIAPGDWKPGFVDYLFLAFNTSTAFSPTDVPVLSRWAKAVMMVQGAISLATIAILVARGISLL